MQEDQMTPTNPDFFDDLKDWSERKLQLLENYVAAASKIMGIIGQVYYIDGFAGEGIYDDGSKGSPVRIAELAQQYKREAKPYSLTCINIEENKKRFTNLQSATAQFGNLVLNLQGTFTSNISRILREIGNQPTICFLDPFGLKGIDWVGVEKIINRSTYASTDLWIRFDAQTALRLRGFFDSQVPNAEQYLETLASVFGIADKDYLNKRLAGRTVEERFQNALSLYKELLVDEFRKLRRTGFADIYPIRTLEGKVKYYLVFATAHPKGITLASEVVYKVEEDYQRQLQEFKESQPYQLSLFSIDPTQEEIDRHKAERLKEDIWEAGKGQILTRNQIYTAVLTNWFGKITSKHLSDALKKLQQEGRILKIDGPLSQDTTRFTFQKSD